MRISNLARLIIIFGLFHFPSVHYGQQSAPLRNIVVDLDSCTILVDKNTLMPSSIQVKSMDNENIFFAINNNLIIIDPEYCLRFKDKSIRIQYRTFGFDISKPMMVIDTTKLPSEKRPLLLKYDYTVKSDDNKLIDAEALNYRGSFSRGISIGNSQNLAVNSNFDMQLIGDLGNGLKIVAAITDESLPIQAEGNTQQLQEFDKVFIQVSKNRTTLTAGDYILARPESHFMNYFKKLKGLSVTNTFNPKKEIEASTQGSFAISNGKFARQSLVTNEGNQGPYRLVGPNGERFIIVLAGTEKIYFNGKLLKRGYDFDYVIDYNRAEVTFSPTRVIARDSRVIIEFEYTDISYLRSLYAADATFKGEKWQLGFHFYNEQDSKNGTGDLQLDTSDIRILAEGGEPIGGLSRPGIRSIALSQRDQSNLILYKGIPDPLDPSTFILVFTTDIDSAQYTAIFTDVGDGRGDYIIDNSLAKNGRVYKYIGKGLGSYLPIVQLIPPEKKQLITLVGKYQLSKSSAIISELSMSHQDKNRLSSISDGDNMGVATFVEGSHNVKLDSLGDWKLATRASHEYVSRDFVALNPYRSAEFSRDWNIGTILDKGEEHLGYLRTNLSHRNGLSLDLGSSFFDKSQLFTGRRQEAALNYVQGRWQLRSSTNYLQSTIRSQKVKTAFHRPNINAQYFLTGDKRWSIGVEYDGESNQLSNAENSQLKERSYSFHYGKAFLHHDVSETFGLVLAASQRVDDLFKTDRLTRAANATEIEVGGKWSPKVTSDLQWNIIARDLQVVESSLLPNDISKKSVLGKLDYNWSAVRNGIRSTTSYNTNAGQEPKIEYVFQRVEVGQGEYFLINDSENPNLTNVQDFRYDPSNPLAKYIRLSLVNNEFIRTNNIEINQNFQLDASKFWELSDTSKNDSIKHLAFKKFVSRFSTLSNVRISKKQLATSALGYVDYVDFGLSDTSVVAYSANNTHSLFFNRGHIKYEIQLGTRRTATRVTQVNGIEDRGLEVYFIRTRWNIVTPLDFFIVLESSNKTYASALFADRNLNIHGQSIKPEINYRPTNQSRIIFRAIFTQRQQRILNQEKATIAEYYAEYSLRKSQKYSVDIRGSYLKISFDGKVNSPLEYDMLESLKNGDNFLWGGQITKRMAKNIDLSFVYDGRKTGISLMAHIGRAQLKATF